MKQSTKNPSGLTIGLDVGDRKSVAVVLDANAEVIEELKIASTKAGIHSAFGARPTCRVALEVGTHSPWMSELIMACGHEVIVANPRKVYLIGKSQKKTDRVDAEILARLPRLDPKLLSPIQHRKNASRLPSISTPAFDKKAQEYIPEMLRLCRDEYPETSRLRHPSWCYPETNT